MELYTVPRPHLYFRIDKNGPNHLQPYLISEQYKNVYTLVHVRQIKPSKARKHVESKSSVKLRT